MIPGSIQTPSPIIPKRNAPRMELKKNRPHGIGLIIYYGLFRIIMKVKAEDKFFTAIFQTPCNSTLISQKLVDTSSMPDITILAKNCTIVINNSFIVRIGVYGN